MLSPEMNDNKDHWYDGWIYDKFIAPNQDKLFEGIINLIEPGSEVVDVGCGTGRFSFHAAWKCKSVLGIDISKRNIDKADQNLRQHPVSNLSFRHTLLKQIDAGKHFDYAVSTYVIHEIDEESRVELLREMSLRADKILIGDYAYPRAAGLQSTLNEIVEFAAGRDHYTNYKLFLKSGGIKGAASKAGLKIISESIVKPVTAQLVVLSK